jgi:hypothetical protein
MAVVVVCRETREVSDLLSCERYSPEGKVILEVIAVNRYRKSTYDEVDDVIEMLQVQDKFRAVNATLTWPTPTTIHLHCHVLFSAR